MNDKEYDALWVKVPSKLREKLLLMLKQKEVTINKMRESLESSKQTLFDVQYNAPGYDWNADPKELTLKIGDSFKLIDDALSFEQEKMKDEYAK